MKRYMQHLAMAAVLLLGLTACEGFLDTTPTSSVVDKNAMVTLADAGIACNGLYTPLKYYTLYGTYIPYMGDLRADNLYPRSADGTGAVIYTWQYESTQSSYFGTLWDNYYNVIMRCNTFIENIDACEASSSSDIAKKQDYTGQAYAVRALCYFDLARLYGQTYTYDNGASLGAVLITETVGPKEARLPRSTVAETYNQVLSDLAKAKELLSRNTNLGHFNYWAARLLEARVYLYMGRNSEALAAATDVISNSPYRMVSGDGYANYWGREGDLESVLELLVSVQGDIDSDGGFYTIYHNLWFDDANAGASLIPTLKWRNLFKDTPNDVRGQMIQYDDPATGAKKTGEYWLRKFIGNKDQGYTFRRNNPRVMRITEAYLIAAEAALAGGNTADASRYLNAVRKRADVTASDVTATKELIQIERQKEFIGEGHRFFDVMRTGGQFTSDLAADPHDFRGGAAYTHTLKPGDTKAVMPISSDARVSYPELQQNPGYKE
ncbi:MAG: RagB/SusD family nutrient uptake outer membrane protein [Bacteroidales bacterium]|nr:RagB/SusD family nutrient uptake outer membrane protein [Bacteroidales bacterium]